MYILNKYKGLFFVLPFFIAYLIFQVYPMIYSVYLSFTSYTGFTPPRVTGDVNYIRLFHDTLFWKSFVNTVRIWILSFVSQMIFAFVLSAVFVYSKIRGKKVFRAIFYLPNFVTAASVTILFSVFLSPTRSGIVNSLFIKYHLISKPFFWLNDVYTVIISTPFISWWMWFGHAIILLSAGLTAIPKDYFDAGRVEGAKPWQAYVYITLPLVRPTILYMAIMSLIGGMRIYDIPALLTANASPDNINLTMVLYMYNTAFVKGHYGYASTIGIGIFVIVQIISIIMFRWYIKKQK